MRWKNINQNIRNEKIPVYHKCTKRVFKHFGIFLNLLVRYKGRLFKEETKGSLHTVLFT